MGNYEHVFSFQVVMGRFRISHKLYVSVLPSLYDYYKSRSHSVYGFRDYQKFVTEDAVGTVAQRIWEAIPNGSRREEQFSNAVLMIVQQLTYKVSAVKYPVETLVEGEGDCDTLSLLAASIMKVGGLDVVLLYYEKGNLRHMNVGVNLPSPPTQHTSMESPLYYEYEAKKILGGRMYAWI